MQGHIRSGAGAALLAAVLAAVLGAAVATGPVAAQTAAQVAVETQTLGDFTITLYPHPFLTEEDLAILRLVASDAQYLAMFVPTGQGHAALAASPDEGFVKDSLPVPSAIALGGLSRADEAAQKAVAACQEAAKTATPCVVILAVAPK
jgi:hypothetical protein